jgi:uncharacterized protein (UPF0147 family)
MRVEDFLTHSIEKTNLDNARKQSQQFTPAAPEVMGDKVSISWEAREAQKNGVDLTEAAQEAQKITNEYFTGKKVETEAAQTLKMEFKSFMDVAMGRVIGGPKSPEEKLEELTEKMKKLKSQLSDVMTDTSMPENVKNNRAQALTTQISAVQKEIDAVGEQVAAMVAEQGAA